MESTAVRCCYGQCQDNATTDGYVFAKNHDGGNHVPTFVKACEKHKNISGFFENK